MRKDNEKPILYNCFFSQAFDFCASYDSGTNTLQRGCEAKSLALQISRLLSALNQRSEFKAVPR